MIAIRELCTYMKEARGPLMVLAKNNTDAKEFYERGATFCIQQEFLAAKVICQMLKQERGDTQILNLTCCTPLYVEASRMCFVRNVWHRTVLWGPTAREQEIKSRQAKCFTRVCLIRVSCVRMWVCACACHRPTRAQGRQLSRTAQLWG